MKSKVGLLLPEEVVTALENASGKSVNGKQKWVAYSAAMLLFATAPAPVRSFFLRAVWGATIDDDFSELAKRAASGSLEQELTAYLTSAGVTWSVGAAAELPVDEVNGVFPGEVVSRDPAGSPNESERPTAGKSRTKLTAPRATHRS